MRPVVARTSICYYFMQYRKLQKTQEKSSRHMHGSRVCRTILLNLISNFASNLVFRIGLTGTPLQNRLLDFWSVLDWANPGCLGDKEDFTCDFGRPIMQGQRFDGTKRELATGRKSNGSVIVFFNCFE